MKNRIDELEKLASLHERGALSDTEFTAAKASILQPSHEAAEPPSAPALDMNEEVKTDNRLEANSEVSAKWSLFRPITTEAEARSLLSTGYYAAAAGATNVVTLMLRGPGASDEKVLALIFIVAVCFFPAWRVAAGGSRIAAWCLLVFLGLQIFGAITANEFSFISLFLAVVGVLASLQAVQATSALRRYI